jgi:hypothetical protein
MASRPRPANVSGHVVSMFETDGTTTFNAGGRRSAIAVRRERDVAVAADRHAARVERPLARRRRDLDEALARHRGTRHAAVGVDHPHRAVPGFTATWTRFVNGTGTATSPAPSVQGSV